MRLPTNTNDEVDEDPTGTKALWDRGLLNGASQKAETITSFHVGDTILSLEKATLIPGGSESLVYTTLSGAVGIMVPFTSHEVRKVFLSCKVKCSVHVIFVVPTSTLVPGLASFM